MYLKFTYGTKFDGDFPEITELLSCKSELILRHCKPKIHVKSVVLIPSFISYFLYSLVCLIYNLKIILRNLVDSEQRHAQRAKNYSNISIKSYVSIYEAIEKESE